MKPGFHAVVLAMTLAGGLALREAPDAASACDAPDAASATAGSPARDWVDAYIAGLEEDDAQDGGLRTTGSRGSHVQCSLSADDAVATGYVKRNLGPYRTRSAADIGDEWVPGGGRRGR